MPASSNLTPLQARWTSLYTTHLPALARANSPAQAQWPVHLDHCFARIILDSVVGRAGATINTAAATPNTLPRPAPWTARLKSPAVKNMSESQLTGCIALAEDISEGRVDLVELDRQSLGVRGKAKGKGGGAPGGAKRKAKMVGAEEEEEEEEEEESKGAGEGGSALGMMMKMKQKKKMKTNEDETREGEEDAGDDKENKNKNKNNKKQIKKTQSSIFAAMGHPPPAKPAAGPTPTPTAAAVVPADLRELIVTSGITPFRQRVLLCLCQIPGGRYSTYLALARHLASSPRAVGNALRNNPFAPRAPCHRVVAADGGIGGFNGQWGDGGMFCGDKVALLRGEGVRVREVGGKLRVEGTVWEGFVDG